jgi:phage shock protein PspC (stress-responsive transcriptional regulator)
VAGTNLGSAKSTIEMALDQGLIMGLIEGIAGIYNGPRLRVRVVWKVIDSVTI